MADFPLLRSIFGVPTAKIDAAIIERAIADRVAENEELDWKQEPYTKGSEIAKDLAAFANHRGGIIVLGVAEDDHAASSATPVTVPAAEVEKQFRQAAASHIQPFLGRFTVRQTDSAAGGGHYVIIEVEPSRDAPHAQIPNGPSGSTLAYPVRNGADTRHLKEFEVAVRYRDRAVSRADLNAELLVAHDKGNKTATERAVTGTDWEGPSLSVAAVPVNRGSRQVGSSAREAETTFFTEWDRRSGLPGHSIEYKLHHKNYRSRPAPQRTVFTTPDTVVELGHRGTGFLCHALTDLPIPSGVDDSDRAFNGTHASAVLVPAERIEWALFVAINFLIDHAIDTGASGEVELRAQLHFTHGAGRLNGGICTRIPGRREYQKLYELPSGSRLSPITTAAQITAAISGTDDSHRSAAIAAFFLAVDIFAEFGVDTPHIFTDTGDGVPDSIGGTQPPGGRDWLTTHLQQPGAGGSGSV
ncbi:helix-turn-helix domain-containing protein [Nocardia sp. 348MFTsu5.1]|uniref:AlbA family DNA-binding domain-containing protein n=1 Tax=Nocardia sp. 348MFTsu5.1 TaxID=1172185 RepID=UPI00039E2A4E|nr:ATP-binding protein [Nocardia sp. 348MFTsu5.1]